MDEKNTGTTVTETITAENSGGDPKGNADNAAAVSTNEGAENDRADAVRRAEAAEAKCTAFSKGVKSEAVDDVIALAMAKVSDSVTIEQAIDEVIVKYPVFCGQDKPKAPQGADMSGGGRNITDGVTARFLAKNPNIKI